MSVDTAHLGRKLLDGLQYAVLAIGVTVAVVGSASLLFAGDLVVLKWVLFLGGLLAFGVGSFKLRPTPAWRDEPRPALGNARTESGYGAVVKRLPPVAWLDYDREEYLSDGARIFLLGVLALGTSFALEAVFGVGVPRVPDASASLAVAATAVPPGPGRR